MKKMRLHLYIVIGVFLTLIVLGSFFDLQINQAIFSQNNGFGIAVAGLSLIVGYGVISMMGGVVAYHALKITKVTWQKILFMLLGLVYFGVATYFAGKEIFGPNAWYMPSISWAGYLIAAPLMGGMSFLGFLLGKKANNPKLWILMVVGAAFIIVALILGTTVVKSILHRPRYRLAIYEYGVPFHEWWEKCGNYKDYMTTFGLLSEEFKSFPSGHTSVNAMTMLGVIILPFILGKEVKNQILYFYLGLVWTLFVGFTRMLVGAHFLSDIGFGGLITAVCLYCYYEVILNCPKIYTTLPKEVETKTE